MWSIIVAYIAKKTAIMRLGRLFRKILGKEAGGMMAYMSFDIHYFR